MRHKFKMQHQTPPNLKLILLMCDEIQIIKNLTTKKHSQIWRRLFVHSVFVTIECIINYLRKDTRKERKIQDLGLSKNQEKKLYDFYWTQNKSGKKTKKISRSPFAEKLIFAFDSFNNANFVFETIDRGSEDWHDFKEAIKIRNRITHPRSINDLYVSNNDLNLVQKTMYWILDTFIDFSEKGIESLSGQIHGMERALDKYKKS